MSTEEEAAKAIGKVAEFGTKALGTAENAGGYLAKVFGTLPENLIGLGAGDWLHHMRVRNLARLGQKTEEILRSRGVTANVDELSPSIALPLLGAAVDETRPELQELWAKLLANAMDPKRRKVRQSFIEAIKQFDPIDALVFQKLADHSTFDRPAVVVLGDILKTPRDEMEVSLSNLLKIGCIMNVGAGSRGHYAAEKVDLSPFGRALIQAVRD